MKREGKGQQEDRDERIKRENEGIEKRRVRMQQNSNSIGTTTREENSIRGYFDALSAPLTLPVLAQGRLSSGLSTICVCNVAYENRKAAHGFYMQYISQLKRKYFVSFIYSSFYLLTQFLFLSALPSRLSSNALPHHAYICLFLYTCYVIQRNYRIYVRSEASAWTTSFLRRI